MHFNGNGRRLRLPIGLLSSSGLGRLISGIAPHAVRKLAHDLRHMADRKALCRVYLLSDRTCIPRDVWSQVGDLDADNAAQNRYEPKSKHNRKQHSHHPG
jgi:hypothetical protein